MKKSNKQYCVYCGEENNIKDKKCSKCHRKLNPKSHDFLDYLKNHIKSDLKSNAEDKAISIITNYLKSHLYGLILTFSVIASAAVVVHVNAIDNSVQKVESKPTNIEETIKYAGEGLTSLEVVNLYVDALANKDMDLVKSLQYDTFFEIDDEAKELMWTKDMSFYMPEYPDYVATTHDLADKVDIYFKSYNKYSISENISSNTMYGLGITYCSFGDDCDDFQLSILTIIILMEVDNNYYILQEVPYSAIEDFVLDHNESLIRRIIMYLEGDVSNVSINELILECYSDYDCYKEVCSQYTE